MCWDDLVMNRKIKSQTFAANASVIIPARGNRLGLHLSVGNGGRGELRTVIDGTITTIAHCANLIQGTAEFNTTTSDYVSLAMLGDLIYQQFTAQTGAGIRICVVETWIDDPPDVAAKEAALR